MTILPISIWRASLSRKIAFSCEVLESRLKAAGIQYRVVDDVRLMLEMGLTTMPMLETDDMMMNYPAALKWLEEGKMDHES